MEKIINLANITGGLKDFQRRTVDYVFSKLYLENTSNKFLVADEVGLGKTLIARGVIAKAIDYSWNDRDRIDIIYICSNSEIASQNIDRLNITGESKFTFAKRITLMPLTIHNLKENKVNFASFTPGTSFDLRSQGGVAKERALLYHILRKHWGFGDISGALNIFQCSMNRGNWKHLVDNFDYTKIDRDLSKRFLEKLNDIQEIKSKFIDLNERFSKIYKNEDIPAVDLKDRKRFIGQLRELMAETCIDALQPDLVILDEFQRFKYLLDDEEEVASLARSLFNYPGVKILLLSATPYKMYTMYHESEQDNHYIDLMQTVGFLLDSDEEILSFEDDLQNYRKELFSISSGDESLNILEAKARIERRLSKIMVRNERVNISKDQDAMIAEESMGNTCLTTEEIKSFAALDKIAGIIGSGDTVNYWKSAPYLLNFMTEEYKLKRDFVTQLFDENKKREIAKILAQNKKSLLSWDNIYHYHKIDPMNAKLRSIIEKVIDIGSWKLLWIPPSLQYYQVFDGPYSDPVLQNFTKSLIFSSWKVVPRVISMICSYEAERRILTAFDKKIKYTDISEMRTLILRFAGGDKPANMSNFNFLYPSITLSKVIDILKISVENSEKGIISFDKLFSNVKDIIRNLFDPIIDIHAEYGGFVDDKRWYWAALALLDTYYNQEIVEDWFDPDNEDSIWTVADEREGVENEGSPLIDHLNYFREFLDKGVKLGRPPEDLFDVLTKVAVGSPAVTALRSCRRLVDEKNESKLNNKLLTSAAKIAFNFRTLFNLPDSIYLIRSITSFEESRYWESVLDYCINGNIQSLLDEYLHVLRDTNGLTNKAPDYALERICEQIEEALTLRTTTPEFDEIILEPELKLQKRRIRCRYALSIGDRKNEEGEKTRIQQLRTAFNSPFKPFILASTSIGQEGLDFHLYSHRIHHWNLPSNPVDMEQREGRIHRYKGHAVRRNVANDYEISSLKEISSYDDPWDIIFKLAQDNREPGLNDMIPFWIYDSKGGQKIYRDVPALPLSNDLNRYHYLKKTLGAYRMVFGQPRQEDLLKYLSDHIEDGKIELEDLMEYRIDLSPK